jgi:hypothetical protein
VAVGWSDWLGSLSKCVIEQIIQAADLRSSECYQATAEGQQQSCPSPSQIHKGEHQQDNRHEETTQKEPQASAIRFGENQDLADQRGDATKPKYNVPDQLHMTQSRAASEPNAKAQARRTKDAASERDGDPALPGATC